VPTLPVQTFLGATATTWLGILTIVAIVVGPIFALCAQRISDRRREKRARKVNVFRELMATRGTRLSGRHVEALNAIEVEFYGTSKKEKAVLTAWRTYLDHLTRPFPDTNPQSFTDKRDSLFIDLIYEVSKYLAYDFDKLNLKNILYIPIGHARMEDDLEAIRNGLKEVLTGRRAIPIAPWQQATAPQTASSSTQPTTPAPPARSGDGGGITQ